ncbi:MAG: hypothetical protein AMS25_15485 [Gemmatimonas sp. SM23_52]|nr:MAG: hypothetical protein AMS25_15485 [Gemmatimonas sp. SM23_52]
MPRKVPAAKRRFKAPSGREWEAGMHAGSDAQAPNLLVIFRDPVRVQPDRYNTLPPGSAKVPREAATQMSDDALRALLQRSVRVKRA